MSPIKILRVKRAPGQERLLREISEKLKAFDPQPRIPAVKESCIGCGKIGIFMCMHCKELQEATKRRSDMLWQTVEEKFASERF